MERLPFNDFRRIPTVTQEIKDYVSSLASVILGTAGYDVKQAEYLRSMLQNLHLVEGTPFPSHANYSHSISFESDAGEEVYMHMGPQAVQLHGVPSPEAAQRLNLSLGQKSHPIILFLENNSDTDLTLREVVSNTFGLKPLPPASIARDRREQGMPIAAAVPVEIPVNEKGVTNPGIVIRWEPDPDTVKPTFELYRKVVAANTPQYEIWVQTPLSSQEASRIEQLYYASDQSIVTFARNDR